MSKERIVVICPGRGSYTRDTNGYLKTHGIAAKKNILWMDKKREEAELPTISMLDKYPFKTDIHMQGGNASPLIYACSLSDFLSIDQNRYEIVAITGNSMGWYIALALGDALDLMDSFDLIQTMGSIMNDRIIGGQIIYPIMDDNWRIDKSLNEIIMDVKDIYVSIYLGGYLVIGGEQKVLDVLMKRLPKKDKYPYQLPFHAAFHTPLMESISIKAMSKINQSLFQKPSIPLVDGRGNIWTSFSSDISALYQYTLGYQVTNSYDFTSAIIVSMKEFCPDKLVLLGPGSSLGGSIGQIITQCNWLGINSKDEFKYLQKTNPYLISMGIENQREIVSR